MKKNNIDASSIFIGIDKIAGLASDYMKQKQEKVGTFFSPLNFSYFMNLNNGFIDIEKKKANFSTNEFEKLLETYKLLFEASYKEKTFDRYKEGGDSELLKDGKTILNLNEINCLKMLWARYYSFTEEITPDVSMITSDGKGHATAKPALSVAINSKCLNKKAAYEFVKLMLSEEFQENASTYYLPVNKKAYSKQRDIFLKGRGGSDYIVNLRDGGIKSDTSARKIIADIDNINGAVDKCSLVDYKVYGLVSEKVDEFLKDKNSAGDTAKSIQETVQNYLDTALVKPKEKALTENAEKPKSKLKLSYPSYFDFAKNALRVYKNEYKNVEVEVEEETDDFKTKLVTEVISGNGPDLILFLPYTFDSLHKVVSGGAFSCLDDMILSDKDFNLRDYNENVLKAGVYEGKRYFIPLSFNPHFLFTTSDAIKNKTVMYDKTNWTWSEFANQAKTFMKSRKNDEPYFFGYSANILDILRNSEISFIDYKNKKTSFSSKEFVNLLKAYRELCLSLVPENIGLQESNNMQYLSSCIISNIGLSGIRDWNRICYLYNKIKQYKADVTVIPMPSYKKGEEKFFVEPSLYAAINSNCKNKQVAFDFMKVLLSIDIQRGFDSNKLPNFPYSIPVNKSAYEEDKKLYSSEKAADYIQSGVKVVPLSSEITDVIDSLVKNGELAPDYDLNTWNVIQEEADSYAQGKKTVEEAAAEIDRKVMLIINE